MKTNIALLILRLAPGLMMLTAHGWKKLIGFSMVAPNFPDPIGLGSQISLALTVFSEVFCSVFLIIGLFTRIASIPLIITMLVAVFVVHSGDPFSKQELGLMYLCFYLIIALLGPGDFSIDKIIKKKS